MEKIIVYEKPTCTTCRSLAKILYDKGISYEKVDYYVYPFTKVKLKNLIKKMGVPASELLRRTDSVYKDLDLRHKNYSDDELIELMVLHPDLVQRPIVEMGNRAVLARPPHRVNELF
jgi:arsenate reductase (glutaredoxin)